MKLNHSEKIIKSCSNSSRKRGFLSYEKYIIFEKKRILPLSEKWFDYVLNTMCLTIMIGICWMLNKVIQHRIIIKKFACFDCFVIKPAAPFIIHNFNRHTTSCSCIICNKRLNVLSSYIYNIFISLFYTFEQ